MYAVPKRPSPIPTRQIHTDVLLALIANSMTSAMNQAEVPKITIGSVCLTRRAYFLSPQGTLVDSRYVNR